MKNNTGQINILECVVYTILIVVFSVLLNMGLIWVLNNWVLQMLNWFNGRTFLWKIVILIAGGFIVVGLALGLVRMIGMFLGILIFDRFQKNNFTHVVSMVVFICGSAYMIFETWSIINRWSMWVVIEFLVLCGFILATNYLPVNLSEDDAE